MSRVLAQVTVSAFVLFASCGFLSNTLHAQEVSIPTDLTLEGLNGRVKRIDEETATVVTRNGVTKEVDRRHTRSAVFDDDGRISYEWIAIVDLPPFRHQYEYDKEGRRLRRTSRQGEPNDSRWIQTSLRTFRFDKPKRILFVDEYRGERVDPKTLRQIYEYHFDESGRVVERVTRDSKSKEVFRTVYSYDSQLIINGERLSMAENPVGQIFAYENTPDAQGNWIRRRSQMTILQSGEKRTEVIYRKISYRK